jgi:hypothetical protein
LGVFAALHCLFVEVDPEPAEAFFVGLENGADLSKADPLLHLRNQISRPRRDRMYSQSPHHVAALTIKAFNLRRADRSIDLLSFKKTESFPAIELRRLGPDGSRNDG